MKTMKNLARMMFVSILSAGMMTLTACSSDDDMLDEEQYSEDMANRGTTQGDRTVLVYLAGYNNLSGNVEKNVSQLKNGSKNISNGTLLVFVRSQSSGKTPWLARIEHGQVMDSLSVDDLGIRVNGNYACDPEMMGQVMKYAFSHYPAKEYGLVLGGHSTGWLIEEEPNKSDTS